MQGRRASDGWPAHDADFRDPVSKCEGPGRRTEPEWRVPMNRRVASVLIVLFLTGWVVRAAGQKDTTATMNELSAVLARLVRELADADAFSRWHDRAEGQERRDLHLQAPGHRRDCGRCAGRRGERPSPMQGRQGLRCVECECRRGDDTLQAGGLQRQPARRWRPGGEAVHRTSRRLWRPPERLLLERLENLRAHPVDVEIRRVEDVPAVRRHRRAERDARRVHRVAQVHRLAPRAVRPSEADVQIALATLASGARRIEQDVALVGRDERVIRDARQVDCTVQSSRRGVPAVGPRVDDRVPRASPCGVRDVSHVEIAVARRRYIHARAVVAGLTPAARGGPLDDPQPVLGFGLPRLRPPASEVQLAAVGGDVRLGGGVALRERRLFRRAPAVGSHPRHHERVPAAFLPLREVELPALRRERDREVEMAGGRDDTRREDLGRQARRLLAEVWAGESCPRAGQRSGARISFPAPHPVSAPRSRPSAIFPLSFPGLSAIDLA